MHVLSPSHGGPLAQCDFVQDTSRFQTTRFTTLTPFGTAFLDLVRPETTLSRLSVQATSRQVCFDSVIRKYAQLDAQPLLPE